MDREHRNLLIAILRSNLFIAEKLSTSMKEKRMVSEIGMGVLDE